MHAGLPEFIIVYTDVAELADDDVDVGGPRAHRQHLHDGLTSKLLILYSVSVV